MNQLKVFHEIMSRRLLKRRCGKELRQIFQYRIEQKNSLGAFHRGLRFTVFGTNGKRNDVVTNEKYLAVTKFYFTKRDGLKSVKNITYAYLHGTVP